MSPRDAVARGVSSVAAFLRLLLMLGLVLAVVGPILWYMPVVGLRFVVEAPGSSGDALLNALPLTATLLSGTAAAAFFAGVAGPWCDSLPRAVLCGAVIAQVVVLPAMQFGPPGWTGESAGWLSWFLWTALGTGALWRYWSNLDRSWRSHFP